MKWLFIGLGCALTAAVSGGIWTVYKKSLEKNTDHIDGGVVKRYRADMPKVIESQEITEFHCTISLLSSCDVDDIGHRVYKLDASVKDGEVFVKYDWRDRGGKWDKAEYQADADFMVRLQEIVTAYDFAKHNGYYHTVSGLPDMYGESLDIVYASGERIYVHDNQSGFLPYEAEKALVFLFGAATKLDNESFSEEDYDVNF